MIGLKRCDGVGLYNSHDGFFVLAHQAGIRHHVGAEDRRLLEFSTGKAVGGRNDGDGKERVV